MAVFLPGLTHPRDLCSICDAPAAYIAVLRIRITDPGSSKMVASDIDLYVCEAHADKMDIEIQKSLKVDKRRAIII